MASENSICALLERLKNIADSNCSEVEKRKQNIPILNQIISIGDHSLAGRAHAALAYELKLDGDLERAKEHAELALKHLSPTDATFWKRSHYVLMEYYARNQQPIHAAIHEENWRNATGRIDDDAIIQAMGTHLLEEAIERAFPDKYIRSVRCPSDFDAWLQGQEEVRLGDFPRIGDYVTNSLKFVRDIDKWIQYVKAALHKGLSKPLNVLLLGPPGSGKSFFAKQVSKLLGSGTPLNYSIG